MAWEDGYLDASFRGVPFHVESHQYSSGRQGELHVYPLRDDSYFEDLGRQPHTFTLSAVVVGEDYFAARDALREALEAAGPGELVHPYLGTFTVAIPSFSFSETFDEGGLARFSIECVRTGENVQPSASAATGSVVSTRAGSLIGGVVDRMNRVMSVDGPGFLADNAAEVVQEFARRFETELARFGISGQELAELSGGIQDLITNVQTVVRSPSAIATAITNLYTMASQSVPALGRYTSFVRLAEFVTTVVAINTGTPSSVQDGVNRDAIHGLARRTSLAHACEAAAELEFASYDEAVRVRDTLSSAIDAEIDLAASAEHDEEFVQLGDLYAAMVRDLNARAAHRPRLRFETLPASIPAVLLAQRLYGDATRADEIVARNRVRHPLFLPGGEPLEVLSA